MSKQNAKQLEQPVRLLVVDDNQDLVSMLHSYFSDTGYEVDVAYNGVEAINQCRQKNYDVILLDIFMPEKDGIETLKDLKANNIKTKIITMTGMFYDNKNYLDTTLMLGADATLCKPFSLSEALIKIQNTLFHT